MMHQDSSSFYSVAPFELGTSSSWYGNECPALRVHDQTSAHAWQHHPREPPSISGQHARRRNSTTWHMPATNTRKTKWLKSGFCYVTTARICRPSFQRLRIHRHPIAPTLVYYQNRGTFFEARNKKKTISPWQQQKKCAKVSARIHHLNLMTLGKEDGHFMGMEGCH